MYLTIKDKIVNFCFLDKNSASRLHILVTFSLTPLGSRVRIPTWLMLQVITTMAEIETRSTRGIRPYLTDSEQKQRKKEINKR